MISVVVQKSGNIKIQFLSGDYYDLAEDVWMNVNIPFNSFNIGHYDGQPMVVGTAQQNTTHIIGDTRVMVFDEVNNATLFINC